MTDIYEVLDFGYDPSVPENIPIVEPPRPTTAPPPKKTVNAKWLPPVGKQTTPSCFVWASTYGVTTFAAAKANKLDPTSTDNQASPIYTYIKVEEKQGTLSNTCVGGRIVWCFDYLNAQKGTASMTDAPYEVGCDAAWTSWENKTLAPNPLFQPTAWQGVDFTGTQGLDNLRSLIALDIQNSFGTTWGSQWNGSGGYVWMDCNTFQATMQGSGIYITQMASPSRG